MLDTRFLREYFYATDEEAKRKTSQKLKSLLSKGEGILPTIVITEITQITCEIRGKDMAKSRYQALIQSGLQIENLTPTIAEQAGLLKCLYKNVPIGDCIIAATANENHAKILSDDPHFDLIKETKRVWL
ncbi:MAG: PIN domain-containing protein [Candidatus Bathyarchaeia archaeon]